jgi:hypothetical protein
MQQVPAPAFANARDVRELIAHAGGEEHATRRQVRAARQPGAKAGLDRDDAVVGEFDAVPTNLRSARLQQVGRWHPIAREEALHVRRGCVPWRTRIDDQDASSRTTEDQGGGEARRSPTHHEDVV